MPPARHPIPDDLLARPFTVAEARERGVSREVLRGGRLRAPFRGVRVATALPESLTLRCRAALLVLPDDAAFGRRTAARLRQIPLPGTGAGEPLDVVTGVPGLRHHGMRLRRAAAGVEVVPLDGLPVTAAPCTWLDLCAELRLDDAVVAGDALLRRGWTDVAALAAAVRDASGRRGVARARTALGLLDAGAESAMETLLRLLLVRAGLPRPCANRDVVVDGEWIARPDLSYPGARIAIEYEGDHHRTDRRQWRHDKARRRLLEDAGWLVIEVTADDVLRTPELTVARVRAALVARSS